MLLVFIVFFNAKSVIHKTVLPYEQTVAQRGYSGNIKGECKKTQPLLSGGSENSLKVAILVYEKKCVSLFYF